MNSVVSIGFVGNTNANVSAQRIQCISNDNTLCQSRVGRAQACMQSLLSHAMSGDPTLGANVSVTVTLSAGAQTMSSVPKQCASEIGGWPKQWDASSTEGTGSVDTRDNVLIVCHQKLTFSRAFKNSASKIAVNFAVLSQSDILPIAMSIEKTCSSIGEI